MSEGVTIDYTQQLISAVEKLSKHLQTKLKELQREIDEREKQTAEIRETLKRFALDGYTQ